MSWAPRIEIQRLYSCYFRSYQLLELGIRDGKHRPAGRFAGLLKVVPESGHNQKDYRDFRHDRLPG